MNNKGFVVTEANLFWTDEVMGTMEVGHPLRFFEKKDLAESYRQDLEIKKWKLLLLEQAPELDGLAYERPKRDTLTVIHPEGKKVYKIKNQLYWIVDYYTLLSYETFLEIEAKLKEKGFDLKPEMSEEGIITFINICENLMDNFPKFYLVQEVELIED